MLGGVTAGAAAEDWHDFKPLVEVVMGMGAVEFGRDGERSPIKRDKKEGPTVDGQSSDERYECQTCGRSYKHYFHLKAHRRECSIEPLFRCDECHKRFYHSRNLGRHMQNVHKLKKKKRATRPTAGRRRCRHSRHYNHMT